MRLLHQGSAARHALSRPTSQCIAYPSQRRYSRSAQFVATQLPPRWLSELNSRIGKCITFGLKPDQVNEAGEVLQEIARDWRELLAGSEGFLSSKNRRGLYRREVAWGDMDSMGHVNNVMYNRYAESARINWTLNFAAIATDPAQKREWGQLLGPTGIGLILRSIKTDYKFPMKWPDHVTVLHKLRSEPKADTDHFILDVVVLSELHRRVAARCVEDIVVYDYRAAKKTAMKPYMVEAFRETFRLQEEAKKIYANRARDLIKRVQQLEKGSWDRSDAEEDFGSAGP